MTQYVLAAASWLNLEGIFAYFRKLRHDYILHRKISDTIKELSALTDKELNDIGLSRGDIWSVAHETYYDNQTPEYNRNLKGWV